MMISFFDNVFLRWLRSHGIFFFAICVFSQFCYGASFKVRSMDDLVSLNTHSFKGEVLETKSKWKADKSYIYTEVKFRVETNVFGKEDGDTIYIYVPGGSIGSITQKLEGGVSFKKGEKALVLVNKIDKALVREEVGDRAYNISANPQNKYNIVLNADGESVIKPEIVEHSRVGDGDDQASIQSRQKLSEVISKLKSSAKKIGK